MTKHAGAGKRLVSAAMLIALFASCTKGGGVAEDEAGGGQQPNWERPLANAVAVEAAADASVAFVPTNPGQPDLRVLLASSKTTALPERELAWVFGVGRAPSFVVFERLVAGQATMDEWQRLAKQEAGCTPIPSSELSGFGEGASGEECFAGTESLVSLSDGTTAMLHAGGTTTAVHFLAPFEPASADADDAVTSTYPSPAVEIVVMGPAQTFTKEQATSIADQIEQRVAAAP